MSRPDANGAHGRSLARAVRNRYQGSPLTAYWSDAMRLLRDWSGQRDLWRDYRETRRQAASVREYPFPSDGKPFLVMSLSNWAYQIKVEAMLGLGLRLRGMRPLILLRDRQDRWGLRYFRALGFTDFLFLDDFELSKSERRQCQQDASELLEGELSVRIVKEWRYRGCWIGPQIVAAISRKTREGAPDLSDPAVLQHVRKILPEVLQRVLTAEKLIGRVQPELMYVLEPNYEFNGPITDTAVKAGINVIQASSLARGDAMLLRKLNPETRREHVASIAPGTFERLLEEPWNATEETELVALLKSRCDGNWSLKTSNDPVKKGSTREQLLKSLDLEPDKKLAIVFSHILWDGNLFYGEDLFDDFGEWFLETVRAATLNDRVNWLIKLHPANAWKREREKITQEMAEIRMIREHLGPLPPHVKLLLPEFEINNESLYQAADYGITVRGTISIELPCLGTPVFTAGTGRSHGMGFTIDSRSREEYLDRLAHIEDYDELSDDAVLRAKRFAHTQFHRREWRMKSFQAECNRTNTGVHPLDFNLHMRANSVDEMIANGDLQRWAEWAVQPDLIDYLDH